MTFLPKSKFGSKKSERELDPIPQPIYMYLSGLAFLVNLTPPDKQFLNVKSVFKSRDHL